MEKKKFKDIPEETYFEISTMTFQKLSRPITFFDMRLKTPYYGEERKINAVCISNSRLVSIDDDDQVEISK